MTKLMKKSISLVLALVLALSVLCVTAFAAGDTHTVTIVHHYNMATVMGGSVTKPEYSAAETTAHAMDGTDGYPDLTYTETFTVNNGGSIVISANNHPDGLADTAYSEYNFSMVAWSGVVAGMANVETLFPNGYVVGAYSGISLTNVTNNIKLDFSYRQNFTPIWVYVVTPDGTQTGIGLAADTVASTYPSTGCVREWNNFTFDASAAAAAVGIDLGSYQISAVTSMFANTRLDAEKTAQAGTSYDAATGILSGVNVSNQDYQYAYGDGTYNYGNFIWIILKDITYSVTYDFNGGTYNNSTDALVQEDIAAGTSSQLIANPTRTGYTFTGWTVTTDNEAVAAPVVEDNAFSMPAANVTLTANWVVEDEEIVDEDPPLSGPTDDKPTPPAENKPATPDEEEILDDSTPLAGPNTGDTAPIALFAAVGVISLAAITVLIAKRKKTEEQ